METNARPQKAKKSDAKNQGQNGYSNLIVEKNENIKLREGVVECFPYVVIAQDWSLSVFEFVPLKII
jgi:hypothetical protein